ncbi:hypothetical protein AB1K62_06130 [Parasphingorhabdus sp. JC815]|uniref:hypothetical protein n=1 Tax=Parasphingorhabdus sp. JC815 TaxID=3232140 RepID=UPI00345A5911
MCDDSEANDQSLQGNVLPLFPRDAFKNSGKEFAANSKSEPDSSFEMRTVRYYPDAQKEYSRNLLRRLMSEKELSPQALRDEIMEREDAALIEASGWKPQRKNAAPPREDRLLSRADLKNWLGENATHQIGDDKFYFVDRFIETKIPVEQRQALDASIRDSKRQYQLLAFRDFGSHSQTTDTAWQRAEISKSVWLCIRDGFHTSQDDPTLGYHFLLLIEEFRQGVAPVTLAFGSRTYADQLINHERASDETMPAEFLKRYDWQNDKLSTFVTGYAFQTSCFIEDVDDELDVMKWSFSIVARRDHRTVRESLPLVFNEPMKGIYLILWSQNFRDGETPRMSHGEIGMFNHHQIQNEEHSIIRTDIDPSEIAKFVRGYSFG